MTGPCFVDANVFVYAQDARDPRKHRRAEEWLDALWRARLGRTSAQALSEFYVVATRKLRIAPEIAWEEAGRYFGWHPQPVDEALLRHARDVERRHGISWWDSMIVAAAQLQNCDLLLTEDLQDGMALGGVTVRSPFTLALGEPAPRYDVAPITTSRHRPRGRPKRAPAIAG
jgi:predicted nucleic acid-binding protein